MKTWKKVVLGIVGVILVLTIAIVGIGAKMYLDVSKSVQKTYQSVERTKSSDVVTRDKELDLKKKEAFSVLLLGIDTGDLGRTEQGRSDTIMVVTVNPTNHKTTIVSIPRDSYVEIVGRGTMDKINHAYAFGDVPMAMDTVSKFLDIPIDHYAAINMAGLKELVDAIGGVEVGNTMQFTQGEYTFPQGRNQLDGDKALAFSRNRYDDPRGDYGRQERQRSIVEAVAKKLLSLDGVTKYQGILNAMAGNVKTDITFDQMQTLALDYREAANDIRNDQMQGEGFMQDGISYQRISDAELSRVRGSLKQELDIRS